MTDEQSDAPDSEGWWAFEGHEWLGRYVRVDGQPMEDFEDRESYYDGETHFIEGLGDPVQTVLFVRYSRKGGESVSSRRRHGPYKGEPFLGYVKTLHSWDHTLHTPDMLIGKWTKLSLPWERKIPSDVSMLLSDLRADIMERMNDIAADMQVDTCDFSQSFYRYSGWLQALDFLEKR